MEYPNELVIADTFDDELLEGFDGRRRGSRGYRGYRGPRRHRGHRRYRGDYGGWRYGLPYWNNWYGGYPYYNYPSSVIAAITDYPINNYQGPVVAADYDIDQQYLMPNVNNQQMDQQFDQQFDQPMPQQMGQQRPQQMQQQMQQQQMPPNMSQHMQHQGAPMPEEIENFDSGSQYLVGFCVFILLIIIIGIAYKAYSDKKIYAVAV